LPEIIILILRLYDGAQHLGHRLNALPILLNEVSFAEILVRAMIDFYLHLLLCFAKALVASALII